MATPRTLPGEPVDVGPLGDRLHETQTRALFKSRDLEVMWLVLPSGKGLPPHKVAGELTIQCIEGVIDVTVDGAQRQLNAGQLLYLPGDVVHDLTARVDASALVTVVVRK